MPRPDGRIEPGQPLRGAISARAWNRAQDAADIVLGAYAGTEGGVPGSPALTPYTWVYCKPSVTVARWGVLAITGMEITPTSSSGGATASFEEMPVLTGGTPSATTTAWCVAVEPIESGKVGRVAVGGVVQCRVNIKNDAHQFVTCFDNVLGDSSTLHLTTANAGEGLILWKETGTGSRKWALVRLGTSKTVVRGIFEAPWFTGATLTVFDAANNEIRYIAKNYLTPIHGTGTRNCVISYVAGEWVLVEFNLLQLDGYSAGKSQVLGTVSGALKWIDTTACT